MMVQSFLCVIFTSFVILFSLHSFCVEAIRPTDNRELLVYTAATDETDGYIRYKRSLKVYDLRLTKTLGMNQIFTGYSFKIRQLRQEVEQYKNRDDIVILFTDCYDVVFTAGKEQILKSFDAINASIVFSAETNCWPLESLESQYPNVEHGYKFLNSGGIIGYASQIYKLLPPVIEDSYDDQLFYSDVFLNKFLRTSLNIKLDTKAMLFQNGHNTADHLELIFHKDDTTLFNKYTNTTPLILHGNGNSKLVVHVMANYLAKSWVKGKDCLSCLENRIHLEVMKEEEYPFVLMALFVDRPTPFLRHKLDRIEKLTYPKKQIKLLIFNKFEEYDPIINEWIDRLRNKYKYRGIIYSSSQIYSTYYSANIKNLVVTHCLEYKCDYTLFMNSEIVIENFELLQSLISHNKSVIAPMMNRLDTVRSNFYSLIDYSLSPVDCFDFDLIFKRKRRGVWVVSQVEHIYLVKRKLLADPKTRPYFHVFKFSDDQSFSACVRMGKKFSLFLHIVNLDYDGYLTSMDQTTTDHLHNDLWQATSNFKLWSDHYLHPDYGQSLAKNFSIESPCPGVFWVPLFTELFCQQMIATAEHFGQWSAGTHEDLRLYDMKENVPSSDIYLQQIGYENQWKFLQRKIVQPLLQKLFNDNNKGKSTSTFVVRYDHKNHSTLDPHQDSAVYSINLSLNKKGVDYEGGGTKFLSSNCSVVDTRVGWALIHAGNVDHQGLKTTKGLRYLIVSFIS